MKCTRCNNPLERDEKRGCSFCPICHPPKTAAPAVVEPEKNKVHPLNVNVTEERVREICREEIKKSCNCDKELVIPEEDRIEIGENVPEEVAKSWREVAKSLDIPLYQRKKDDVLAEIAEKTKAPE